MIPEGTGLELEPWPESVFIIVRFTTSLSKKIRWEVRETRFPWKNSGKHLKSQSFTMNRLNYSGNVMGSGSTRREARRLADAMMVLEEE